MARVTLVTLLYHSLFWIACNCLSLVYLPSNVRPHVLPTNSSHRISSPFANNTRRYPIVSGNISHPTSATRNTRGTAVHYGSGTTPATSFRHQRTTIANSSRSISSYNGTGSANRTVGSPYRLQNATAPLPRNSSVNDGLWGIPFQGIPMRGIGVPDDPDQTQCMNCQISAEHVDVFYWPDPNANDSCISKIGPTDLPATFGGTPYDLGGGTDGPKTPYRWVATSNNTLIEMFTLTTIHEVVFKQPMHNVWTMNNPVFSFPPLPTPSQFGNTSFPQSGFASGVGQGNSDPQSNITTARPRIAKIGDFTLYGPPFRIWIPAC